jgi:hypothetical protein
MMMKAVSLKPQEGQEALSRRRHPAPSASEEQALIRFSFYCEESALELAARLRVLVRSIMAGPDGLGRFPGRAGLFPVSYANLRSQFENYLIFLAVEGLTEGNPYFPIIQDYLVRLLPVDICQAIPLHSREELIAQIEEVMAVLTGGAEGMEKNASRCDKMGNSDHAGDR